LTAKRIIRSEKHLTKARRTQEDQGPHCDCPGRRIVGKAGSYSVFQTAAKIPHVPRKLKVHKFDILRENFVFAYGGNLLEEEMSFFMNLLTMLVMPFWFRFKSLSRVALSNLEGSS